MKRLILHIGQSKTGSTSLQYFFSRNRLQLAQAGIAYPSFHGSSLLWKNRARHHLADLVAKLGIRSVPPFMGWEANHTNLVYELGIFRESAQMFSPSRLTFDKLQTFILGCQEDTILISSEALLSFKGLQEKLRPFANAITQHATTIDVVCFLRPQHLLINSAYAQSTKRLINHQHFADFCQSYMRNRHRSAGAKLRQWKSLPSTTVVAVPFTSKRLHPSIESVFFKSLNLEDRVGGLLSQSISASANQSPGPMTVEACRRAAKVLGEPGESGIPRHQRRKFSKELVSTGERLGWNKTKFNGLTNEWRDHIRDVYADQNDIVARRYWGESWQDVFHNDYQKNFVPNEVSQSKANKEVNQSIDDMVQECAEKTGINLPARLE